jgi:hypothetical protein
VTVRYIGAMTSRAPKRPGRKDPDRENRLKAALKANLARRKAQTRARADEPDTAEPAPETDADS